VAKTAPFTIGAEVSCTDGVCGTLRRVIIDPVARSVTHLVVDPRDALDLARLVPVDLVDLADATSGAIGLRCTRAEFGKLDPAEETHFVPAALSDPPYGPEQALAWPYYGLGPGLAGVGPEISPEGVLYETVPLGEVDVHRGEHVQATDGGIGHVQGLVIERESHHVTHVLLQEGHLWDRKQVAIPIRAVTAVDDDGIHLSLTKQQVEDLPEVDVDHPDADATA
jgi:sporulation protein YlmC with PRC-barrel domain